MYNLKLAISIAILKGLLVLTQPALSAKYILEPLPDSGEVRITIELDSPSGAFHMPAWAPGDYRIVNFGSNVKNISFTLKNESVLSRQSTTQNSWIIPDSADRVTYTVSNTGPSFFTENVWVTQDEAFFEGPAIFGYFDANKDTQHELHIKPHTANGKSYCALDNKQNSENIYVAPDYERLIDSPILVSNKASTREFIVAGKLHYIVAFRNPNSINISNFEAVCTSIVNTTYAIFNELPYKRYIFFFDVGGSGGGLEHADSARMAIPRNIRAKDTATFIAHEFFHAFNVKRIRPAVFTPFDLSKPAVTASLWWLEGVTSYYAEAICYRAGINTKQEMLNSLSWTLSSVINNSARTRITIEESSLKVWEASNSAGYGGINYYESGTYAGLILDAAIRGGSNGKNSLDDVLVALYKESNGGKIGFKEDRIKELCVIYGGSQLGVLYDMLLRSTQPFIGNDYLNKIGLVYQSNTLRKMNNLTKEAERQYNAWPLQKITDEN